MNVQEVMQDYCLVAQECGMAKGVSGSVLVRQPMKSPLSGSLVIVQYDRNWNPSLIRCGRHGHELFLTHSHHEWR